MQHARRSASRTVPRRATYSIATRGHPHTASADTRHSYVTHQIEDGVDPKFVQEQVGHRFASTTAIYTGVSTDFMNTMMRNALDRAFTSEELETV